MKVEQAPVALVESWESDPWAWSWSAPDWRYVLGLALGNGRLAARARALAVLLTHQTRAALDAGHLAALVLVDVDLARPRSALVAPSIEGRAPPVRGRGSGPP